MSWICLGLIEATGNKEDLFEFNTVVPEILPLSDYQFESNSQERESSLLFWEAYNIDDFMVIQSLVQRFQQLNLRIYLDMSELGRIGEYIIKDGKLDSIVFQFYFDPIDFFSSREERNKVYSSPKYQDSIYSNYFNGKTPLHEWKYDFFKKLPI